MTPSNLNRTLQELSRLQNSRTDDDLPSAVSALTPDAVRDGRLRKFDIMEAGEARSHPFLFSACFWKSDTQVRNNLSTRER